MLLGRAPGPARPAAAAGPRSRPAPRRTAPSPRPGALSPHWPRNSRPLVELARRSRRAAMPLTTRSPQNGGVGTGLSTATSERAGMSSGARQVGTAGRRWHPPRAQRRQLGAGHAALDRDERVHQPQPLEGVAGVADLALVDLGEVLLDVGAGSGPRRRGGPASARRRPREFISSRFSFMTTVDLTSRPDMPITSASCSSAASRIARHRLLDAEVDDGVAVVGQDDVDEVLADVVDVALDRGQHDRALALLVGLLHVRLEVGDRGLHDLGATAARTAAASRPSRTARRRSSCPSSSVSLTMSRAGCRCRSASSRSASRPLRSPSMMRRCEPLVQRQRRRAPRPGSARRLRRRRPRTGRGSAAAGRRPSSATRGRRRGRGRPRAARRRSAPSAGSSRRARSPSRARP